MRVHRLRITVSPNSMQRRLMGLKDPGAYQMLLFSTYPVREALDMPLFPVGLEERVYIVVNGNAVLVKGRYVLGEPKLSAFNKKVEAMLYGNPLRCAARAYGSKAGIRYSPLPPPERKQREAVPEPVVGGEDISLRIC